MKYPSKSGNFRGHISDNLQWNHGSIHRCQISFQYYYLTHPLKRLYKRGTYGFFSWQRNVLVALQKGTLDLTNGV